MSCDHISNAPPGHIHQIIDDGLLASLQAVGIKPDSIGKRPSQPYSSSMVADICRSRQADKIKQSASAEPAQRTQPFAFLSLPLEIRPIIYGFAMLHNIHPSPEEIYFAEEPIACLPPASLYLVNRQISSELQEFYSKRDGPLIIHITPQGELLSSFSEAQILAGRCRDLTRASDVYINIWPPHPERPIDIVNVWRSAKKVQRQLVKAAPLQSLCVKFSDNELASWCRNGKAIGLLGDHHSQDPGAHWERWNDISDLGEAFARIRARSFGFIVEPELRTPGVFSETLEDLTSGWFKEHENPDSYFKEVTLADLKRHHRFRRLKMQEWHLEEEGARIAISKLDEMTCNGQKKLSAIEWNRFLKVWKPRFERLENVPNFDRWRNTSVEGDSYLNA